MPGERHHFLCHVGIPHPGLRSRQVLHSDTQVRHSVLETVLGGTQRGPSRRHRSNRRINRSDRRIGGTIDIDVNVFVPAQRTGELLAALPGEVSATDAAVEQLETDGQTRLWWASTPVDVFLDTTPFHADVGERVRSEPFAGHDVPFLACRDLAVFKAFYDRTKDWADLEEMQTAGTLDASAVAGVLVEYLGGADTRIERLRQLAGWS